MKKVLVVLLLILAVAGGAFAQLSFNGQLRTGFGARYFSEDGNHIQLVPFSNSAERYLGQFRLNGAYTSEDKKYGASFRFQIRDRDLVPALPFFFGYANLFSDMVLLQAGLVDDGTYGTGDRVWDGDMGEGLGVLAHIRPLEGLSVGLGAYAGEASANNTLSQSWVVNGQTGYDIERIKYTFQAAYTLPDLVKVVAGFRTRGQRDSTADPANRPTPGAYFSDDPVTETSSRALLGAKLLLIKDLNVNVVFLIDNIGETYFYERDDKNSGKGAFNIFGTFGYKLGNLNVGLDLGIFTQPNSELNDNTTTPFIAKAWGTFGLSDTIIPMVDIMFGYGTWGTGTNSMGGHAGVPGKWHRKYALHDIGRVGSAEFYNGKHSFFSIRPAVQFILDKNTFIEIGDLLHASFGEEGEFKNDGSSLITNVAYIDFSWTF